MGIFIFKRLKQVEVRWGFGSLAITQLNQLYPQTTKKIAGIVHLLVKNMKSILLAFIFVIIHSTVSAIDWQNSIDTAFRLSIEKDKPVFAFFSGKHCPECRKMKKNVFGQKEFQVWAEKNFITVEISDAASVDKTLKKDRYELWKKYNIDYLPTIILFSKEKHVLIRVSDENLLELKKKLNPHITKKND